LANLFATRNRWVEVKDATINAYEIKYTKKKMKIPPNGQKITLTLTSNL